MEEKKFLSQDSARIQDIDLDIDGNPIVDWEEPETALAHAAGEPGGPDGETPKPPKPSAMEELLEWFQTIVTTCVVIFLAFIFCFRIVTVDGESMLPTVHPGDWLFSYSFLYTPKQGDIVAVSESISYERNLIKRIIATEGQTVDIDPERGVVLVDGVALDEPYTASPTFETGTLRFPMTVPEGHVFLMGDNRNFSTDSRVIGPVDERYIMGKTVLRLFPFDQIGLLAGG